MTSKEMQKLREAWKKRFRDQENDRKGSLADAREAAWTCTRYLVKHFDVKKVYLFGSVMDSDSFHGGSDLDLAVEGLQDDKYFPALAKLKSQMPANLGLNLVPLEDAFPELRKVVELKGKLLHGK